MAGTMVAVFEDHNAAEKAAEALRAGGVPSNDISLVRKGAGGAAGDIDTDLNQPEDEHEEFLSHSFREVGVHDVEQPIEPVEEMAPRAVAGIVAGIPLGALLVATAVMIPGIGPVIAAGPLAAMLTGSIAGGVLGGLTGALTSGGIPVDEATYFHERVAAGDTLVTVLVGQHDIQTIEQQLRQSGGHDVRYFTRLIDSIQSIES